MPNGGVPENSILGAAQRYDLIQIITKGLAYAIIVAGLLSVIFIFIGGISFILSGGQEDKIKQAVSTIRYAIIGLIITIFAVIIVGALGRFIGVDILHYINPSDIFQNIANIGSQINGTSGSGSLD